MAVAYIIYMDRVSDNGSYERDIAPREYGCANAFVPGLCPGSRFSDWEPAPENEEGYAPSPAEEHCYWIGSSGNDIYIAAGSDWLREPRAGEEGVRLRLARVAVVAETE